VILTPVQSSNHTSLYSPTLPQNFNTLPSTPPFPDPIALPAQIPHKLQLRKHVLAQ
jgi:hypothetical protein